MACLKPLRSYDARDTDPLAPRPRLSGGCRFSDEGRGKPGWVCRREQASGGGAGTRADEAGGAEFNLTFGRHPSLTLTYLRSYEGVGPADVELNGVTHRLEPSWAARASMSEALFMQAGWQDRSTFGAFSVRPHATLPLTVRYRGAANAKFKVLSVTSC